jgi:hypothetical protein
MPAPTFTACSTPAYTCPRSGPTTRRGGKNYIPDKVEFQIKQQIALDLIDRALGNGIRVKAWTFDEAYGCDGQFLDGLDQRGEAFVGECRRTSTPGWRSPPCCENPRKRAWTTQELSPPGTPGRAPQRGAKPGSVFVGFQRAESAAVSHQGHLPRPRGLGNQVAHLLA